MKLIQAITTLIVAAAFVGTGTVQAAAPKKPAATKKAPAKARAAKAEPASAAFTGEIELVQQLGKDKGEQLKRLVERFNAESGQKIVVSERDWQQGALPDLLILDDDDEARFLAGKPRYKPLFEVMKESREPLQTFKERPGVMTPVPLDDKGRIVALPVGLSTPIMYFNRDAFKKVGLDPSQPPKTWFDLQQALGKLADAGVACPYTTSYPAWVHIENTSAWHNEPVAATNGKREGPLQINNLLMVKHLAMMTSWYKSRYLLIFGDRDEAEAKFASGECAVLTAPSSSFPTFSRVAKFDVGMAPLPYHDDIPGAPQNTLADGPALWVAAGKKPEEYRVIAKFVSFLLTPQSQLEWQRNAGYLPLNRTALLASSSELLSSELANVRVAVKQLASKPPTPESRATRYARRGDVRKIVSEELDAVWANRVTPKAALDAAVARSRALPLDDVGPTKKAGLDRSVARAQR